MRIFLVLCALFIMFSCKEDDSIQPTDKENSNLSGAILITPTTCDNQNNSLLDLSEEDRAALLQKNNTTLTQQVLEEVNKYRMSIGLSELNQNENLLLLAIQHNEYQISIDDINHDFAIDRFCSLSTVENSIVSFGENTAFGFDTAASVIEELLNSQSHRKNIEGDFSQMSTSAVANNNGVIYYTQIFIR